MTKILGIEITSEIEGIFPDTEESNKEYVSYNDMDLMEISRWSFPLFFT